MSNTSLTSNKDIQKFYCITQSNFPEINPDENNHFRLNLISIKHDPLERKYFKFS